MRMPKARRPRERPWEIFNTRDFGFNDGSQNYAMWALTATVFAVLLGFEIIQQARRILRRGDSCPACESARSHYRQRLERKELEIAAMNSRMDSVINLPPGHRT